MVYLHYISCLRYTILVGNPGNERLLRDRLSTTLPVGVMVTSWLVNEV